MINLGEGRVDVGVFSDERGYGLIFKDTGKLHIVGDRVPESEYDSAVPGEGNVCIHCSSLAAAKILMEESMRIVEAFIEVSRILNSLDDLDDLF